MYNPNAKRRRIKPYARPTSFDYNVRYDIRQYHDVKYNRVKKPFFMGASNDEVFRVMEGELLVKSTSPNARYNDKELHVFSFANGLTAPANSSSGAPERTFNGPTQNTIGQQRDLRRSILNTIQYMGVAVTEFSPSRDVYEQGFVATIAGLNTLYNNGADTIFPGQTVCLDLPIIRAGETSSSSTHYKRATQMGVPRDKLQFILRPHSEMLKDYGEGTLNLVNRFIVGTAISYSRPGDTVDIILHRMNYTSSSVGGVAPAGGYGSHSGPSQHLSGLLLKALPGTDDDGANQNLIQLENAIDSLGPGVKKAYSELRGESGINELNEQLAREDLVARAEALVRFESMLPAGTLTLTFGDTNAILAEVKKQVAVAVANDTKVAVDAKITDDLYNGNIGLFENDAKNGIANAQVSKKVLHIHQVAGFFREFLAVAKEAEKLLSPDKALGRTSAAGKKPSLVSALANPVNSGGLSAGKFDEAIGKRIVLSLKGGSATSTSAPGISAAVGSDSASKSKKKRK